MEDKDAVCLSYRRGAGCSLFGGEQPVVFWVTLAQMLACLSDFFPLSQDAPRNLAEDLFLLGCCDPAVCWMCEQALLSPGQ